MSQINESAIATPGVYINEISSFPPSVAQVSTAIPVFVGYTAQAVDSNGNSAIGEALQISSFAEYTAYFGGLPTGLNTVVTLDDNNNVLDVTVTPPYQMYNSVYLFFQNGGGVCYILSVGTYKSSNPLVALSDFIPTGSAPSALSIIQKIDDITLLVFPDAVLFDGSNATNVNDYYTLMTSALALCGTLQDRFTILDVVNGNTDRDYQTDDVITTFRTGIGSLNLNYGAAYYPFLETTLALPSDYENIQILTPGLTTPEYLYNSSIITNNPIFTQINAAVADSLNTSVIPTSFQPLLPFPVVSDIPSFNSCLVTLEGYLNSFLTLSGFSAGGAAQLNYENNYVQSTATGAPPSPLELYIAQYNAIINTYPTGLTALTATAVTPPVSLSLNIPSAGSSIASIQILNAGTGYTTAPTITITGTAGTGASATATVAGGKLTGITVSPQGSGYTANTTVTITGGGGTGASAAVIFTTPLLAAPYGNPEPTTGQGTIQAISSVLSQLYNNVTNLIQSFINDLNNTIAALELQLISSSSIFSNIYSSITNGGVVVPPSGFLAGVYATTDGTRGVWKAPANVSLSGVITPTVLIDDQMQENLNIDTVAGKSVNAIRTFTGQGTIVWGARTLAGNDNNWRYIPVRRFYIMVESSVKAAAFQFVFEPNVGTTWIRIRSMIESYLTGIWRQGGLAGSTPQQAFYVSVGLGITMTQDDILNGRMIVEIGMAPVRPAEFIILRFTQIQQQS